MRIVTDTERTVLDNCNACIPALNAPCMTHVCQRCGTITDDPNHVCLPDPSN